MWTTEGLINFERLGLGLASLLLASNFSGGVCFTKCCLLLFLC